ncbi:hypothetical protein [Pedobacter alpinus]|uniref:FAD-binding domain-containing protein n=1 Tax=Pedobacter alpinus TaxID=1590643 RepID=A0ABW5TW46_9SPHI
MRIPAPSDILIVGVSPVTLALATVLAKSGLKVLVIDESISPKTNFDSLQLSNYCQNLLVDTGFEIGENLEANSFINQSFKLLAHYLCSVIWETKIEFKTVDNYNLIHNGIQYKYASSFVFFEKDLIISSKNHDLNFRNVFLLAWRVIGIVNERLNSLVLNGYTEEKNLLVSFSDEPIETGFFAKLFKNWIPNKKEINYTDSSVNLHLSHQRDLAAGNLLPDLPFYNEKIKEQISLYKWCNYHFFSLIIIGRIHSNFLFNIAKWVQLNYQIQLFYLPYSEKNKDFFETLGLEEGKQRTLIIRPDRYIGFLHDAIDTDILDNYLRSVLLMKAKAE